MKRRLRLYIPLVAGLFILFLVVLLSNPLDVWNVIRQANLLFITATMISIMTAYFFQTIRFRTLVSTFHSPPKLLRTFHIVILAAVTNVVFPGAGGDIVIRPYLMQKMDKKPFKETFLCVFLERIFDLFALLLIVLIAVLSILPQYTIYSVGMMLIGLVVVLVLFFLPGRFVPFKVPRIVKKYVKILRNIRRIPIRKIVSALLLTGVNVFFIVLNVALVMLALNVSPSLEMIGLFFISALVGMLSMIPGGLGITDGSIAGLFYMQGFDPSVGVSIALINRLVILFVSLVFAFGILPKLKKK